MLEIPKNPTKKFLRDFLDEQYILFNKENAINQSLLDPLLVARRFKNDKVALFCALFAYGNVRAMLKFLDSCCLEILTRGIPNKKDSLIPPCTKNVYRFQNNSEIQQFFEALLKMESLEQIFNLGYQKSGILSGIAELQSALWSYIPHKTRGLRFLIGTPKIKNTSPLKRWNLFLRWVVRKDSLDLGLWSCVKRSDLLLPLDTHTFKITRRLGLLKRKTYDFKAVLEVSRALSEFCKEDPIKYDFALYRIGQLGLIK